MTLPFKPVTRRTVATEVQENLLALIESGRLAPGQQIPTERELGEAFGVARTSVREALQSLVAVGAIQRRGNRTYVAETIPALSPDARGSELPQVFEVRRLLEVPLVRLVAERATDDDRTLITKAAREFTADLDVDTFRALDEAFHATLACSAHNPVLSEVYLKVMESLGTRDDIDRLYRDFGDTPAMTRIIRESGRHHRAIARAIAQGDPDAAASAAEHHLTWVEHRVVSQLV